MSLRSAPGAAKPGCTHSGEGESSVIHAERLALRHALERAYPLAKQLAEILELEAIEPIATEQKHIRAVIGRLFVEAAGDTDANELDLPQLRKRQIVVRKGVTPKQFFKEKDRG